MMGDSMLRRWLEHPLTRGMDLDNPLTSELRKTIIQQKTFLHKIYLEWYDLLAGAILQNGSREQHILELGSGGGDFVGYCHERYPEWHVFTSDVLPLRNLDVVLDARRLPFANNSLDAIVMTNVFHHISDSTMFLRESLRVLKPRGILTMIEPWRTPWAQFVYQRLHHEPFEPNVPDWTFAADNPLSSANGALPWIVFSRDAKRLVSQFPQFQNLSVSLLMPFAYIASGGVSMRSFLPGCCFGFVRRVEKFFQRFSMFAHITLQKSAK